MSAPKIGKNINAFAWSQLVVDDDPQAAAPEAGESSDTATASTAKEEPEIHIVVNPILESTSEDVEDGYEGCGCVPGILAPVPRFREATYSYYTRNGEHRTETVSGVLARVFQHEANHLEGILFLDLVEDTRSLRKETESGTSPYPKEVVNYLSKK